MTYKPIAHESERGNRIYGNDKQQGDLQGYDISPSINLNNVVYSTKRSKSTPNSYPISVRITHKSNQRHVRNFSYNNRRSYVKSSAMSRYEQFGSTNQNNHSEEVFWAARTRKLKKPCSQQRITKGKLQFYQLCY